MALEGSGSLVLLPKHSRIIAMRQKVSKWAKKSPQAIKPAGLNYPTLCLSFDIRFSSSAPPVKHLTSGSNSIYFMRFDV